MKSNINKLDAMEQLAVDSLTKKVNSFLSYIHTGDSSQPIYKLQEIINRYLPDTLAAYQAIPSELRTKLRIDGTSSKREFLYQLQLLDNLANECSDKLRIEKDIHLDKNGQFLEKIVATPVDKALIAKNELIILETIKKITSPVKRLTPKEILYDKFEEENHTFDNSKYNQALDHFSKTNYGKKDSYDHDSNEISRPCVRNDYIDYYQQSAVCIGLLFILEIFLFHLPRIEPINAVDYGLMGIGNLFISFFMWIASDETYEKIPYFRRRNIARKLAWLITINHQEVAPGEKRKVGTSEALRHPEFKTAKIEYEQKLQKQIQASFEYAQIEHRKEQEEGIFSY